MRYFLPLKNQIDSLDEVARKLNKFIEDAEDDVAEIEDRIGDERRDPTPEEDDELASLSGIITAREQELDDISRALELLDKYY